MQRLMLAGIAAFLLGCGKDSQAPPATIVEPYPTAKVTITPDTGSLIVGDSMTVKASVTELSGGVIFTSTNDSVLQVTQSGIVRALHAGSAMIIATSTAKPSAVDGSIIKVLDRPAPNNPLNMPVLGTGEIRYSQTTEVAEAGNYAYTGAFGNAVYVWNVAGSQPILVDSLIFGDVLYISDLHISDDQSLLLVSAEAFADAGVAIYSLADRAHPKFLDRWRGRLFNDTIPRSRRGAHTAKFGRVNGKLHVFAATPPDLTVLDVSNPSKITELVTMRAATDNWYTHDVLIRDGLLFTADWNSLGIWDVGGSRGGTPAKPVLISRWIMNIGLGVHNAWWMQDQTTGQKNYLFVGEEGPGFFPTSTSGDVHVLDISNLSAPKEVAFYHVTAATTSNGLTEGAHNFGADEQNGILYAAFYNGGVRAIDARGDLSVCPGVQRARDGRCDLRVMGREIARGLTNGGISCSIGSPAVSNSCVTPAAGMHSEVGIWGVVYDNGRLFASDMLHGIHVLDAKVVKR